MKIILLNSSVDDFIITLIVGTTAFMFLMKWVIHRLKTKKYNLPSLLSDEVENRFNNYTLNFEDNTLDNKPFELKTKLIAVLVSLVIIIMPLYELIETLRPQAFYYGWSCFPNF